MAYLQNVLAFEKREGQGASLLALMGAVADFFEDSGPAAQQGRIELRQSALAIFLHQPLERAFRRASLRQRRNGVRRCVCDAEASAGNFVVERLVPGS